MLREFEELDEGDVVQAAPCHGTTNPAGTPVETNTMGGGQSGSVASDAANSGSSGSAAGSSDGGCVVCDGCPTDREKEELQKELSIASQHAMAGKWKESAAVAKAITDRHDGHAAAWTVQGMVATNTGSWIEARGFFKRAMSIIQDEGGTRALHERIYDTCQQTHGLTNEAQRHLTLTLTMTLTLTLTPTLTKRSEQRHFDALRSLCISPPPLTL